MKDWIGEERRFEITDPRITSSDQLKSFAHPYGRRPIIKGVEAVQFKSDRPLLGFRQMLKDKMRLILRG
jgi:hypothetical protein